jgi:hypothetical protein
MCILWDFDELLLLNPIKFTSMILLKLPLPQIIAHPSTYIKSARITIPSL